MARHPKEHYKMDKNERHKISKEMKGGHREEAHVEKHYSHGSPSMGHRGRVPATISNDFNAHANLPTEPEFMNYPYCDYLDQYVGDSIVEADRTQDMGAREMRRQNSMEKY